MFLGIEIGGTKLQAGLGDGEGALTSLEKVRARPEAGRVGICRQIAELAPMLLRVEGIATAELGGVGIGFGGPVDSASGRVKKSHQVEGWDDFPIVRWFRDELGLSAVLANDSDMAGLAEATFGAGKGLSPVVYMNIGSGIGGALVLEGKLYGGQGSGAMEIGHQRLAPKADGGPWSTLEDLCSGWNLEKLARQAADTDPDSLLWELADRDRQRIDTKLLAEAVRRDDPTARKVWFEAIERIGVVIANVITLIHPACFVLGGGVAQVGDLFFEPLRQQVARQVFAPFRDSYHIVPAQLGEAVVVHGALKLAKETFGERLQT